MYYKICNHTDVECLSLNIKRLENRIFKNEYKMFQKVLDNVSENIDILCNYYGEERDSDKSLGGYVLLFTSTNEEELLSTIYNRYGISEDSFEYEEIIASNSKIAWKCTCYVISADYGVVIVRPIVVTEERKYILEM